MNGRRTIKRKLARRLHSIDTCSVTTTSLLNSILTWLRAVDAHLGIRSHLDCASTDANIPMSLGIPSISIGAGGQGGGAHTAQEWFKPEGRDLGLKRILLTLCMLLRE